MARTEVINDGMVVIGAAVVVCCIAVFALALRPASFRGLRRHPASLQFDDPTWTRLKRFRRRHAREIREVREFLRGPAFIIFVALVCGAIGLALAFGK